MGRSARASAAERRRADIFERLHAVRPDRLRLQPNRRAILEPVDQDISPDGHSLLGPCPHRSQGRRPCSGAGGIEESASDLTLWRMSRWSPDTSCSTATGPSWRPCCIDSLYQGGWYQRSLIASTVRFLPGSNSSSRRSSSTKPSSASGTVASPTTVTIPPAPQLLVSRRRDPSLIRAAIL